jgi:hypothetical protein
MQHGRSAGRQTKDPKHRLGHAATRPVGTLSPHRHFQPPAEAEREDRRSEDPRRDLEEYRESKLRRM